MNCGTCKHWGKTNPDRSVWDQEEELRMRDGHGFGKCGIWGVGWTDIGQGLEARNTYMPKSSTECKFSPTRWESDKEGAA